MQHFKTYHSPTYRNFKSIEVENFREVVRFFEANEKEITQLEFGEYFEMLVSYSNALYEVGAYSRHILMANVVIEASIEQNVQYFHGDDVYYRTLFRKAASHYHLYEHDKSEHILKELIKMDPYNTETVGWYKKCLFDRKGKFLKRMRASAMVFFLVTPMIIALEVLFIQHFFGSQIEIVRTLWMVTFLLGWVFYLSGDLLHRRREGQKVDSLVKEAKAFKAQNEKVFY